MAGFVRSGKVRGKVSFSLRSGKVRETCNGQGKIALCNVGPGKMQFFIIKKVFDLFYKCYL